VHVGTNNLNISTHNGINKGLKLQSTLLTASATEINQLDGQTVGGSASTDISTNSSTSSLDNKTIDGGTF
jgi:hypothetical protein